MTPEHKAKMAAGRERARLAKLVAAQPSLPPEQIAPAVLLAPETGWAGDFLSFQEAAGRGHIFPSPAEYARRRAEDEQNRIAWMKVEVALEAPVDPAKAYREALSAKAIGYKRQLEADPAMAAKMLAETPEIGWFIAAERKKDLAARKAEFDRMMGIEPEPAAAVPAMAPVTRDDRGMLVDNNPNPDPLGIVAKSNNPVRRILSQLTYPPDKEQQVVTMIASNMAPSWSEWNQEISDAAHPPVAERLLVEHMKEYCMTLRPELPKTRLEPKYELKGAVTA